MSSKKSVKCKICGRKYVSKQALIDHIEKAHSDSIPEGWNAARYENFLRTGKTEGHCVYCKKETGWNNATGKYNRMCGSEECKKTARELANKNYIGLHGKPYSINDPEQQKKMVYGRKNSGTYIFEDEETGKKYKAMYDSSYGKDFFEMLDMFLNWNGSDIIAPSPHTYYYEYEGKKHFYIPDAYSTSLNLEIELKDGGDNPNKHPKIQAVDKVKEQKKDEVMKSLKGQVNYIKICNKDYSEFFALLSELREKDECQLPKWESKLESVTEGYGVNNEPDIDTVIFDFGSVLDKNMSDEKIYEYYETYMKPNGITENEFLALKKDYYDYTDDVDNESLSYEALLRLYEAHVDEKYRKYVKDMIDIYTDSIQLQDYVVPMLDYLTDMGYKIYYLSNQSRYCWDKHSYIYDPIMHYFIDGIISYKVDLVKPDIRIYKLLIEKTGLNPNSSIFFDDREDNVEASIQAGIYAERFTRETVERIMNLPRVCNAETGVIESSNIPYKGLIKRDYQLKNPTLNYDDLILYYRNQLFHKNLTELEWQCTYNELINVRGYLKKVINKGRGEYDERMCYEAKKALKQVNNFIQYMEEENKRKKPVTESTHHKAVNKWYHLVPKGTNLSNGLISPWYMDKHGMDKLLTQSLDKYRNRLCSPEFGIYPNRDPESLSNDEILVGLNKMRGKYGSKCIYLFRFPPYHELGNNMSDTLQGKDLYEVDLNKVNDLVYIDYGRMDSHGDGTPLDEEYYSTISPEDYFSRYDDNIPMIFSRLNHISVATKSGRIPVGAIKKINSIPKELKDVETIEKYGNVSEAVTESKTNQNCVIISCFAGVGKNYAIEYFKKKGLVVNSLEKERDFYKIHKNPETDVAKHIHELSKKSDILFIPYYLEMEARHLNGQVDYYLVYPKLSEKRAFIKRFKELGFSDDQVRYLSENWEAMISDCDNCNIPEDRKISIDRDTYLTDVIETQILGTTISETITMESGDKSTLDKNFKKKSGGNFEFIDLHDPRAKKYLSTDAVYKKYFENIHSIVNGEIVVDKDKDKLAGYIYVGGGDKSKNRNYGFIQTLEVRKEYRGYGLSSRILDDAIKKYNAVDLTVYKDNEVALNLYKNHGFVIIGYGNSKDNSDYWMKLKTKLSKDDKILNESVTMESTHSDKVPVYIVSWNYDSVIGVGAKTITGSLYNHTSVSLTPDLEECYAFSRLPENLGDNPGGGFCREKLSYMVSKHKNARIKVDAVYVSRKTYDKMKKLIKEYEKHQADTKFDYMDFVRIILGIEDNDLNDKNLVCSVFVDHLFKASGFDLTNGKKSNLVTPADLSVVDKNHSNIVTVYSGKAVDYDKRKIGRISFESTLTGHKDIFEPGDFAEYAKYADLDSSREEIEDDKGNYINYQNTNNGVDIMETKFKSNIDKDYKSKGFKSLNSFRKQPINKTFINKYKSEVKLLGDVDKTEYGFAWMDGDNLVGYCMANDFGWLTAIEITNPYKGYGLGEQMLKYAIRNMGVNRLGVHKDNKIAYELYRKNGFKEVPSEMINGSTDKDLIFMTTDRSVLSKVSESTHIEGERDGEKRFPVFVFLTYTDTNIAKLIKGFTHDSYAHSSLSFDTNLDNMLSFDARGFIKENIHTDIYKKKINDVKYSLYMYMASDKEYRSMHSFIDELNEHKEKLRYNLLGLTNFIFGRGSEREDRFFCSEFVSACIQAGNEGIIKTKSYLTTPCMLVKNNNFQFIKRGSLKNYNVKEIDNIVKTKLEEWGYTNVKLN